MQSFLYFILFSFITRLFVGKKQNNPRAVPSLQSYGSYLWVVQFSLSGRRRLLSLNDLVAASQYDQL